jgi:hypothetical protein
MATVAASLLASAVGRADSSTTPRSPTDAVQQATNPVPTVAQLNFEPGYTFPNGPTRYVAQLLFEPILPYDAVLVPGVNVSGFRSVARLEISGLSAEQTSANGPSSASGLSDLAFVDGVVHDFGPLEAGLGFGSVFPMATNSMLGQGKVQVGPAALLAVLDIPWLQLGAVVQALWSVAGDSTRPSLGYATVQPVIAWLLPADCTLFTNDQMTFSWEGGQTTVPLNLGFGRAFSEHFVGQIEGAYTVAGAGKDSIQGVVVLDFQP